MVAAGGVLIATGVGGPAGVALISGANRAFLQLHITHVIER
jgi:hypothetical protein